MRFVVGCLAVIGFLVILAVSGCLGLIGFGLFHAAHKPAYAEKQAIEKDYQEDLAKISAELSNGTPNFRNARLSNDILAIYDEDVDLLGRYKGAAKNYTILNGSGTGSLERSGTTNTAIIYVITIQDKAYKVFIADRHTDR